MRQRLMRTALALCCICASVHAADTPTGLRIASGASMGDESFLGRGVSRYFGVAPLSVHFNAELIASSPTSRSFHDLDYTWDFGDVGAGTWGTDGKSKNMAKGAVATHVYETAGTYTATVTIRSKTATVRRDSYRITVSDPDEIYAGTATTCVSDVAHNDFSGAPAGARHITTDDLSTITAYATPGSRILLHRGSSWVSPPLNFTGNAGPVTIGAYGAGSDPDALGIYANNPKITVTGGPDDVLISLENKQDWRFMDLHLVAANPNINCAMSGNVDMQRILQLRIKVEDWYSAFGWGHWNDANPLTIDQMVIMECEGLNNYDYGMYVGGERIALLGNIVQDVQQSHVCRVWQAYQSVIQHNVFSGSSIASGTGRHALKFHGPGTIDNTYGSPLPQTGRLAHPTQFTIISDNVFGSSGPWPVAIGPQDGTKDEEVSDIIIERNRFVSQYGTQSVMLVQAALMIWARYITVRNNIFDGTGSSGNYTAIGIDRRGREPAPFGVHIYNNTVYRSDNASGNDRVGITISSAAKATIAKNNLVSFPQSAVLTAFTINASQDLVASNNMMSSTARFIDPDNAIPLLRDFRLQSSSPALGKGTDVPVFDDFAGTTRPISALDLGALERP